MKRLLSILLTLISAVSYGQGIYTKTNTNIKQQRMAVDSVFIVPRDTAATNNARFPNIAGDPIGDSGRLAYMDGKLWLHTGPGGWKVVGDSVDLSAYMKYSDSASMLVPYLRKAGLFATSPITYNSGTQTITHEASGATTGRWNSVLINATGHVTEGDRRVMLHSKTSANENVQLGSSYSNGSIFSNTNGSIGFPVETGAGIYVQRGDITTDDGVGSFYIWSPKNTGSVVDLYTRKRTDASTWGDWWRIWNESNVSAGTDISIGAGSIFSINSTSTLNSVMGRGATTTQTLAFNRTLSAGNQLLNLQQGYGLYSDNVGSGTSNTRVWFDAPNRGEVIIGPRGGSSFLHTVRLKGNVTIDSTLAVGSNMTVKGNSSITGSALNVANSTPSTVFDVANSGEVTLFGGVKLITGSGSPETVKTAPVGSMYIRTDGGANTTLYIKESGTGNTGWVAK